MVSPRYECPTTSQVASEDWTICNYGHSVILLAFSLFIDGAGFTILLPCRIHEP